MLLVPRLGTLAHRKVWLSSEAQVILHAIHKCEDSPCVFLGRSGAKPISDIFQLWKELRADLGHDALSISVLRYVFADWQVRAGMSPVAVERSMGIQDMCDIEEHMFHCRAIERQQVMETPA